MQNTPIYGFNKPQLTDLPDITKVSSNFDIVENELARQEVLNGDIFSTINAVNQEALNKGGTPFSINTGTLDSNGNESILSFANDVSTTVDVAFVQPVITSNGTMGGSSFAVSGNHNPEIAYLPFSNLSTEWTSVSTATATTNPELTVYNPTPILLNTVTIYTSSISNRIWGRLRIQGSNDGTSWTALGNFSNSIRTVSKDILLTVNTTVKYKYFKFIFSENTASNIIATGKIFINGAVSVPHHDGGRVIYNGSVIATTANGKTFTANNIPSFDVSNKTATSLIAYIRSNGTSFVSEKTLYRQNTQPSNPQTGVMWFKTLEPFNSYEYNGTSWVETNIVPVGEVAMDGSGRVTSVTHYKYNQNGISVNTRSIATQSLAGVMRVATVADETDCNCEDAAITPASLYDLANYRKASTAYNVDDSVACPYHANMVLVCIQAGTTAATALDTHDIGLNQEITDGTVKWKTKSTIGNREYFVESDWNYSASLAKQVVELTSVRPVIAVYKKTGTNTYTMVTNVDVDVNGNGVQSIKAISKFEGYVLTV